MQDSSLKYSATLNVAVVCTRMVFLRFFLNLGNPQKKAQAQGGCRHSLSADLGEVPCPRRQQGSPHGSELLLETPVPAAGKDGREAFLLILNFVWILLCHIGTSLYCSCACTIRRWAWVISMSQWEGVLQVMGAGASLVLFCLTVTVGTVSRGFYPMQ